MRSSCGHSEACPGTSRRNIIEVSGCQVNIDDDGLCQVAGATQEKPQIAMKMIADLTQSAEVGKTYLGKVAKVVEFGAFVTILPGLDGLLPPSTHALPGIYGHVSELAHHRVANPADEVSEGQEVMVKCIGIDEKSGKIKLSRKALIPKPEGADAEPEGETSDQPRPERRPRPRRDR